VPQCLCLCARSCPIQPGGGVTHLPTQGLPYPWPGATPAPTYAEVHQGCAATRRSTPKCGKRTVSTTANKAVNARPRKAGHPWPARAAHQLPATMSRDRYRNRQLGPYTYPMAEGQATNEDEPVADYDSESARAKNEQSRPSADKRWEVRGVIAAAAITAVVGGIVAIVVALINHSGGEKTQPPTTTSIAPTAAGSGGGSISKINVGGQEITISGNASPGVTTVIVLVPRASGQGYWAGTANVVAQNWSIVIPTPPGTELASPLKVTAYFSSEGSHQPGTCQRPDCLSQLPSATSVM